MIDSKMDVNLLEEAIAGLVSRFRTSPFHFFSERELQAEFYGMCRRNFGAAKPKDSDIEVPLFRHEYNTVWRYRRARTGAPRSDSFQLRLDDGGVAGSLDIAILNAEFVRSCELLVVINKDERRRASIRGRAASLPGAIDAAIEFKMAHVRDAPTVRQSAINELSHGVFEDCRKLGHENPAHAYMLAFSHEDGPSTDAAQRILNGGNDEFARIWSGPIRLLLATPITTYLKGPWVTPTGSRTPNPFEETMHNRDAVTAQ